MVENRQQVGFDANLLGNGLLIWHIDENRPGTNSANADELHRLVDLEAADGNNDMDSPGNRGDSGDPCLGFADNRIFDESSNPNSNLYSGSP